MDSQPSRRSYGFLIPHVVAVVVFGMVAYSGVWAVATEPGRVAVPWMIAGLGGTLGALGFLTTGYLRHGIARIVRYLRTFIVAVAAVVAVTGVVLAPTGMDRGLAIPVHVGLAVALALFAAWGPYATSSVASR